jgi:hypothetical protein
MSIFKSVKKFFKKNLRDIATVVGFAVGGPAGAAIGQGIGSLGEGRSFQDSLMSAGKVYGGANIATGLGLQGGQGFGQGFLGSGISLGPGGLAAGVEPNSVAGFFQGLGGAARAGSFAGIGEAFGALSPFQKAAVLGIGAAGIGGLGAEQGTASMPGPTSSYLTQGLRPATLSSAYGGGGSGLPSLAGPGSANVIQGGFDPITQAYLDALKKGGYGELAFPEFERVPVKDGGKVSRLADGGALPELDLRNTGGGLYDPEGSGEEDTIPALLADGEFVLTKQAIKGLGNGDHDRGITTLYAMQDFYEDKAQNMGLGRA